MFLQITNAADYVHGIIRNGLRRRSPRFRSIRRITQHRDVMANRLPQFVLSLLVVIVTLFFLGETTQSSYLYRDDIDQARYEYTKSREKYVKDVDNCIPGVEKDVAKRGSPDLKRVFMKELDLFRNGGGPVPAIVRTKKDLNAARSKLIEAQSNLELALLKARSVGINAQNLADIRKTDAELETLRE